MQFESFVGDMGAALSGGQKQRLSIARALYRQPKILFMDEGTSHLDVGTEAKVNKTIADLGITRIIVAHRPETIRNADRVLLCEDGKLTEVSGQVSYGNTTIDLDQSSAGRPAKKEFQSFAPEAPVVLGEEDGAALAPRNQGAAS